MRRGVRTSSVLAASSRKKVSEMRGFQVRKKTPLVHEDPLVQEDPTGTGGPNCISL